MNLNFNIYSLFKTVHKQLQKTEFRIRKDEHLKKYKINVIHITQSVYMKNTSFCIWPIRNVAHLL